MLIWGCEDLVQLQSEIAWDRKRERGAAATPPPPHYVIARPCFKCIIAFISILMGMASGPTCSISPQQIRREILAGLAEVQKHYIHPQFPQNMGQPPCVTHASTISVADLSSDLSSDPVSLSDASPAEEPRRLFIEPVLPVADTGPMLECIR